jgi:chorismate mutase/prephenate dehydratase
MGKPGQSSRADVKTDPQAELARLRDRVDAIDDAILERLNERARVVQEVGRLKQDSGTAVFSQGREREIVDRLAQRSDGPFPEAGLAPVFREIISATRSLEGLVQVAFLGPEGTFSHLAAGEQFGELADLQPQPSIAEVFAVVERGKAQLGIVPVENTTDGIVTQSYDRLPTFDGTLSGEVLLRISHDLFSRSGRLADVARVVSHPQPLAQCREWLERNLPGVDQVEAPSTVAACRIAAAEPDAAAIGSVAAGRACGLNAIESAIEDRRDNTTRFLLIGRHAPEPTGKDLTSVVFTLRKDESGALHRLLEPFAGSGVNLTSLQLRPIKGKPWEYLFFVDLEGHASEPRVVEALEAAARVANSYKVLGSFPRAARRRE